MAEDPFDQPVAGDRLYWPIPDDSQAAVMDVRNWNPKEINRWEKDAREFGGARWYFNEADGCWTQFWTVADLKQEHKVNGSPSCRGPTEEEMRTWQKEDDRAANMLKCKERQAKSAQTKKRQLQRAATSKAALRERYEKGWITLSQTLPAIEDKQQRLHGWVQDGRQTGRKRTRARMTLDQGRGTGSVTEPIVLVDSGDESLMDGDSVLAKRVRQERRHSNCPSLSSSLPSLAELTATNVRAEKRTGIE